MRNWKTTLTGILGILAAVASAAKALIDGDPATNPDWAATWAAIMLGIGLITASDAKKDPPVPS